MKKIEIYSTPTCHFCHMAKDYFKEHDLPYTEYDVSTDLDKRSEMKNKSGQMGVPVIVLDDKEVIVGYDEQYLASALDIRE